MADYAVNTEASVPGDVQENATQLLDATREAVDEEAWPTVAFNEQAHTVLLAVRMDADDASDALTVAQEMFTSAWEEAFDGIALPEVLVVKAVPWREGQRFGLLMPHPDEEPAEAEA